MIECHCCSTMLDVDDNTAHDLGWSYDAIYHETGEADTVFWYCPHCTHMEDM